MARQRNLHILLGSGIFISLFFVVALLKTHVLPAEVLPSEKISTTVGYISAVTLESRTVVIEAPLEKEKGKFIGNFTVGGPFTWDAAICSPKCGGDLSDLRPGERVAVRWTSTDAGPKLLSIYTIADRRVIQVNIRLKTVPGRADIHFDGGRLGQSDPDGSYSTHGFWPVGRHKVQVLHPDYSPWEKAYMLSTDNPNILDTAVLKR